MLKMVFIPDIGIGGLEDRTLYLQVEVKGETFLVERNDDVVRAFDYLISHDELPDYLHVFRVESRGKRAFREEGKKFPGVYVYPLKWKKERDYDRFFDVAKTLKDMLR